MVQSIFWYLEPSRHDLRMWPTERRTDRETNRLCDNKCHVSQSLRCAHDHSAPCFGFAPTPRKDLIYMKETQLFTVTTQTLLVQLLYYLRPVVARLFSVRLSLFSDKWENAQRLTNSVYNRSNGVKMTDYYQTIHFSRCRPHRLTRYAASGHCIL